MESRRLEVVGTAFQRGVRRCERWLPEAGGGGQPEPREAFRKRELWLSLPQIFQPEGQIICTAVIEAYAVLCMFHTRHIFLLIVNFF